MTEEGLNFSRSGVGKIYEKMMKGELTEEDMHEAAANTEAILRDGGVDLKVRYMGSYRPQIQIINLEEKKEQVTLETFTEESS